MPFNLDDYEPVEERLRAFWDDYPNGRVTTVLLESRAEGQYIVRAEVWRDEASLPAASGYAEEMTGSNPVNRTSALENCETSAIGRALANLGYAAKGKRPSREEMSKTSASVGTCYICGKPLPSAEHRVFWNAELRKAAHVDCRLADLSSPAPGPAGTAGAGTTEASPSLPPQAGAPSPSDDGEASGGSAPGEGSGHPASPSPGVTIKDALGVALGPVQDAPGPPHYSLRPADCTHRRITGSPTLLSPRKSPRGPVCPRCGLSYITVKESTQADLGSA